MIFKKIIVLVMFVYLSGLFAGDHVKTSAEVRYRFESDGKDFENNTRLNNFNLLRTRLHLKFNPAARIYGFVQLQDSRTLGEESSTMDGSANSIDLHQGYVLLDSLWNIPISLKLGRYEVVYGNERLIGSVGWSNIGRSFDGITIKWMLPIGYIDLFNFKIYEANNPGDTYDLNFLGIWSDLNFGQYVNADFFGLWRRVMYSGSLSELTFGANAGLKINDFQVDVEFAIQTGQLNVGQDIAANQFALNGSYTFSQLPVKPGISLGIDHLSGDDDFGDDVYRRFNTLYATNHKFYGMMDYFLNIPSDTYGLGLNDFHFGITGKPSNDLSTSLNYHIFRSCEEYIFTDSSTDNGFGTELDLIVNYKYDKYVNFQGGAAVFLPGEIIKETRGNDLGKYFYLSILTNL